MLKPEWVHYLRDTEVRIIKEQMDVYAQPLSQLARILEIGGGDGYMAAQMISEGFSVYCIDPDPRPPAYTSIVQSPASKLPFPDNTFDVIFSSNVLEHIYSLSDGFREMQRVLKPDGVMIHSMPTVACSVLTTFTTPLVYPRTLFLALSGYFFRNRDLETPFRHRKLRKLNRFPKLRKLIRGSWIFWYHANPLRIIRTKGHGTAKSPLREVFAWRESTWVRVFQDNHCRVLDIKRHHLMASMNKVLGKRFLTLRRFLAQYGLHVDNIYIVEFNS